VPDPRDPVADLRRIAFLLERSHEATYRVRAFRRAAAALAVLPRSAVLRKAAAGSLRDIPGIGEKTAQAVLQSLAGEPPDYLRDLESAAPVSVTPDVSAEGVELLHLLRGDCHVHSDWSDGGSPIHEMAEAARDLGHSYVVLTDHSPRLTVANGLSAERLRSQLVEVALLNEELAPFRILTGIEVDILSDGTLDQEPELLAQLDLVVASVHSELRMPGAQMTDRMLTAIADPNMDVLGHCTGRKVAGGRTRPESEFDAASVFDACVTLGKAVEINSRPERLDPPKRLLRQAVAAGCVFTVDTDAHAPGQLDWLPYGCERAAACGVTADRVLNTREPDELLAWTGS
jgi:putative hydrolase